MNIFRTLAAIFLFCSACSPGFGQDDTTTRAAPVDMSCALAERAAEPATLIEASIELQRGGKTIRGVIGRPETGAVHAVVIFLHGYTGMRDEIPVRGGEGMFLRAARTFAGLGIASVRFDFLGSGQSDGDWADTTFAGQTDDLDAVLAAVRDKDGLSGRPVYLLGFSQGGLVALAAVAAGAQARGVVLWNPVLDPFQSYGRIFGKAGLETGLAQARSGALDAPVAGTGLNAAFFGGIENSDPLSTGIAYKGPVLLALGSGDRIAANGPENAATLKAGRSSGTEIVVVDVGHALGVNRGTASLDRVIGCSASFVLRKSGVLSPASGGVALQ